MKRLLYLIPIAILLSAPSGPQVGGWGAGGNPRVATSKPFFEFAPASGAGLPSAQNLCDQLTASEKAAGTWTCLNGDGTTATGGETLTVTGTVTTLSQPTCPNGPNCAAVSGQQHQTGEMHSSAATASGTGSTSMCWLGIPEQASATIPLVTHSSGASTAAISTYLELSAGASAYFYVSDGATLALGIRASSVTTSARHLICGTWSSANGVIAYVDGVAGTPAARASRQSVSAPIVVHGYNTTASTAAVVTQGAFVVQTELSAARMAAIARAVLADAPTGSKGEAISESRASVQGCFDATTNTGSILPNNRLCVANAGTTAAQGSFIQYMQRTEEINDAAWLSYAAGGAAAITITANAAVSPVGTLTADRIQIPATTAGQVSSIYMGVGGAPNLKESIWALGNGGSGSFQLVGLGGTCATCSYNPTTWTRCSGNIATAGVNVGFANSSHAAECGGDTSSKSAVDAFVWGANLTSGASLRPYVPATSATVTTAAEVAYATLTNAPALNSIEATYDQPASITANARVLQLYKDANNHAAMYLDTGYSPPKLTCYFTVATVAYSGMGPSSSASATHRGSCSYDGTNVIACVDGTCTSTAQSFTNFTGATRMYVGAYFSTGYELSPSYVVRGVKADPSPTRFR